MGLIMEYEKQIMAIKNPRWVGDEMINVDINHSVYGLIEFTAMPNDVMDYGRQIYADCLAGKYGPIKAAVIEPAETVDDLNPSTQN